MGLVRNAIGVHTCLLVHKPFLKEYVVRITNLIRSYTHEYPLTRDAYPSFGSLLSKIEYSVWLGRPRLLTLIHTNASYWLANFWQQLDLDLHISLFASCSIWGSTTIISHHMVYRGQPVRYVGAWRASLVYTLTRRSYARNKLHLFGAISRSQDVLNAAKRNRSALGMLILSVWYLWWDQFYEIQSHCRRVSY